MTVRYILLTWNPGTNNDEQWSPDLWRREMVQRTVNGQTILGTWSVDRRVTGIEDGDRALLLRQGEHGRGIVAVGEIRSEPWVADHWKVAGRKVSYVDVEWQEALPLRDAIGIDTLESDTLFEWGKVYASGRELPAAEGRAVLELWDERAAVASPLPDSLRGAGFGTVSSNRQVEKAAMAHVRACYELEGYAVTDVHKLNLGWDLTVRRGDSELHVEVKGVSGDRPNFFLTANELRASAASDWALAVVTRALTEPTLLIADGEFVREHASPAVYQVRLPLSAFE